MKNKKSPKVLWNVFLFVICGGSLIFGFVQQRKATESRVEVNMYKQQVDSLKTELRKMDVSSTPHDSIQ
jgi:hypothetical protein